MTAMPMRIRVGRDGRITIPRGVRKQLGIVSGDSFSLEVRGGVIILNLEPRSAAERLRGLHKEIWEGIDAQEYVNQERDAWEE